MVEEGRAPAHDILEPRGVPLLINDRASMSRSPPKPTACISARTTCTPPTRGCCSGPHRHHRAQHQTVALAQAAPLELLDYVAIGGVYGTTSKDSTKPPIGIAGLRDIVRTVRARKAGFPICAIAASMPVTPPMSSRPAPTASR